MSNGIDLNSLAFFASQEHDCSYLDDHVARTLFADPEAALTPAIYDKLIELGFRRSGDHLYRPQCPECDACWSARIPVAQYTPKRSDRRIVKLNSDLTVTRAEASFDEEHFALYSRYLNARHPDGSMAESSSEEYINFLTSNWSETQFNEFRLYGKLLAVAVTDRVANGLSAVYTFFDPEEGKRSLGKYAIQWQIEACIKEQLTYLYLGYWIENCQKMAYKGDYRPLEYFRANLWHELS
ncbi:arginyltransferase [Solemya pervernicosa gill symbiont]|uniref:Aspartate/glutamate leucyltransferase n=2 Tax=Gammaproteobacteria incertae sedis TaxID=118884 RepID=A0A1T2L2X7_9GAMM|nr:arginyltransferase [Candidatus Reidiella endopervernicosa]OOZ39431.1 arginyltransferase [Solemya pervernicosa gill symbiont]QKQ26723.1 arginyltransferase [Candidatus Reidiella endopervernicosa]